jgi:hypothetical protein
MGRKCDTKAQSSGTKYNIFGIVFRTARTPDIRRASIGTLDREEQAQSQTAQSQTIDPNRPS